MGHQQHKKEKANSLWHVAGAVFLELSVAALVVGALTYFGILTIPFFKEWLTLVLGAGVLLFCLGVACFADDMDFKEHDYTTPTLDQIFKQAEKEEQRRRKEQEKEQKKKAQT